MPCEIIYNGQGFLCHAEPFHYKGYRFEFHRLHGYSPLRKDGELSKRRPSGFDKIVEEFDNLRESEKIKYLDF